MDKIEIFRTTPNRPGHQTIEADHLNVTVVPESGLLTVEDGTGKTYGYNAGAWSTFELTRGRQPA